MPALRLWPVVLVLVGATPAHAWDNHAIGTMIALGALPDAAAQASVTAEPLSAFLAAERVKLEPALRDLEIWAHGHVGGYPQAPVVGAHGFNGATRAGDLPLAFAEALRINPAYGFPLVVQGLGPPLAKIEGLGPAVPVASVSQVQFTANLVPGGFLAVPGGAQVPAWLVAATGSDEPDYGPDLGLFEDNGTDVGKRYGFGPQPFGNPHYEFSSSAPFHMGFFHEAVILYKAAPFLARTFPELRLKQYLTLARLAFATGHGYWGWRFTGLGLHYIQDLTQPYHVTVFPNASVIYLLWINGLDLAGFHHGKERLIQIVNNRHLALENYLFMRLKRWLGDPKGPAPSVVAALADGSRDGAYPAYSDAYAREVITEEAHAAAGDVDDALTRYLPERLVDDETYIFGQSEPGIDVAQVLKEGPPEADERMTRLAVGLAGAYGTHTRAYVRAALARGP